MKTKRKPRASGNAYHGMKWIRSDKRLAIYLRDGLACAYCGAATEAGAKLTLDHLEPYSKGGSNHETNLVTACFSCNSARGARAWRKFAANVATYHGTSAARIMRHVERTTARPLDVAAARALIARRGTFTAALKGAAR